MKNQPLHIAMIGQKYIPSRAGGIEVVVGEISTRLVEYGYDVTCYNRTYKENKNCDKKFKGVNIVNVKTIGSGGLKAYTASFFATIKALHSDADIVHYHAEGPCYWLDLIKKRSKKKIVVTIHGLDWQRKKWGKFASHVIKKGEQKAVKYADEIIVLSKNVKKYFKTTYDRETTYIPNGVDKPTIVKSELIKSKYGLEKDDYILYLGRIVPEKGIHYLIEAYNNLKTDKKLVIAGGCNDQESYCQELKELVKDNDNVIFTGFVEGQEMEELYSNAFIYCLPSDLEGMSVSLLEAMSYGNCCVVSNIKECVEVVSDKAVIFEKGNVTELTESLQSLCDDKKKVEKYKTNASSYILKKYGWDSAVEKTMALYSKVNK